MTQSIAVGVAMLALTAAGCGPDWRTVTSSAEGFSVSLPAAPEIIDDDSNTTPFPKNWRWYKAEASFDVLNRRPSANYMIGVGTADTAEEMLLYTKGVNDFLDKETTNALKGTGKLVRTDSVDQNGCSGSEREFGDEDFVVRARVFSCERRIFALVFMGSKELAVSPSDGGRFFSSFRAHK